MRISDWSSDVCSSDLSDPFPKPFANDVAARAANNNALPPDLSLMVKAREGGAAYIHSILTGYEKPDPEIAKKYPDFEVLEGLNYNPYFPSPSIAMAHPINSDGQAHYVAGTKQTGRVPFRARVLQAVHI